MIRSKLKICSLSAVWLSLLLVGPVRGQLTDADIQALKKQGKAEGWTFKVSDNAATKRPLSRLCGLSLPSSLPDNTPVAMFPATSAGSLPAAFDWRSQGGLPPIRSQGDCGSCWAFATVGCLECAIKIQDGVTVDLSEQYLLSCNAYGYSCDGGWWVHDYHTDRPDSCGGIGAVPESAFPYQEAKVTCSCPFTHTYRLRSWAFVDGALGVPSTDSIKQAMLMYGPIGVCITTDSAFQGYSGGVFNACAAGLVNHMAVLVGWDDTQGTNGVWILRNSWGTDWGENGYMRIEYGCSSVGWSATYVDYAGIDSLRIRPSAGLSSAGEEGGPFEPNCVTFTLTNTGTASLQWTASKTQSWLNLDTTAGTLGPNAVVSVTASLTSVANSLPVGNYSDTITFRNVTSGINQTRTATLRVGQPDYFTELFESDDNDLQNRTVVFTPNGSGNFYAACSETVTTFPTNPSGGTTLTLDDDDSVEISLTGGKQVSFYGESFASVHAGSNGYVTLGSGDTSYTRSLENHFGKPRIAALLADLSPQDGGTVSYKQTSDRLAITYQNVKEYETTHLNSFQIEVFFDGRIAVTWLRVDSTHGLAGLSQGAGVPADYAESNLSNYHACGPKAPVAADGSALVVLNTATTINLSATDDGLPNPPGSLSYKITSLPTHGALRDPGAGPIGVVPYTLAARGQQVVYQPAMNYEGSDSLSFKANDGGAAPSGGDSAEATVTLNVGGAMLLLSETFESSFTNGAPPGWTREFKTGTVEWAPMSVDHSGDVAHGGTYSAVLYAETTSDHETYLVSPAINLNSGTAALFLSFWHKQAKWQNDQDTLTVVYRTGSTGAWTTLASYTDDTPTWTLRTITLPSVTGTIHIGFLGNARYGYGVCIDDVVLSGRYCQNLELTVTNDSWGTLTISPEPNDANNLAYARNTIVTLTAVPIEGKRFGMWEVFDPNYPNDANHAVLDANASTRILLNTDRHVNAVFKCGQGTEQILPPYMVAGVVLVGMYLIRRR